SAPAFRFADRHGRLDFRSLGRLDVRRIRGAGDVDALESCLANVTYAQVSVDDITSQTDDALCKLVQYMQCCLEYMMYVQTWQGQSLDAANRQLKATQDALAARDAEVVRLQQQLDAARRGAAPATSSSRSRSGIDNATDSAAIVDATGRGGTSTVRSAGPASSVLMLTAAAGGSPPIVYRCAHCRKAFQSFEFLDEHCKRRHPTLPPPHASAFVSSAGGAAVPPPVAATAPDAGLVLELQTQRDILKSELTTRNAQFQEVLAALAAKSDAPRGVVTLPPSSTVPHAELEALRATIEAQVTLQSERFVDRERNFAAAAAEQARALHEVRRQMADMELSLQREIMQARQVSAA
ncbi:MAG: hypothetical protein EOO41_05570, partial [Methanobacteriota archaeon]